MSDEHDSWFKDAFGLDLGQSLNQITAGASAAIDGATSAVSQAVQEVQGAVEGAIAGVAGAAAGAVKKVAGAVAPSGSAGTGGGSGGGSGTFPLGGSVGRGGKNAASDVRAVQAALGIGVDGQCGGQTIAAIEAFQRNMGMAKADGRVDAGGGTERALAGGARPSPAAAGGDAGSLPDQLPASAVGPLATNAGILEAAEAALIAAGEVTGVTPAARKVGAVASQAGGIVADDPLSAAAGLGFGAVQGLAPGGFIVPSPKPESKAFELGRGVGMIGGGVAAVAIGGGEEVIGTGLDATGVGAIVGVPINILGAVTIASGVTSAGVGVATVGGVLSSGGGGESGNGPPTERDPPKPPPEPAVPKANVPLTPAQAQLALDEAIAEQKIAEKASTEATQEVVRFRAKKPFDPLVAEALEDQAQRASAANVEAINRVRAAERALRDANARAKGASGGGGFPPPRR